MTNEIKIKPKESIWKKWIVGSIIVLAIIIVASSGGGEKKGTEPASKSPQVETASNAFKLASMEIGYNNPPESLVKTFDDLLEKLEKKCPQDSEVQIANYIFKGQKLIKEQGGGTVKLLDFGNALDESIPGEMAGVVNCAEIAATLIVLMTTK